MDNDSVADEMNRGLFLAPDLIGEDEEDPLLEQAEANAGDEVLAEEPDGEPSRNGDDRGRA